MTRVEDMFEEAFVAQGLERTAAMSRLMMFPVDVISTAAWSCFKSRGNQDRLSFLEDILYRERQMIDSELQKIDHWKTSD